MGNQYDVIVVGTGPAGSLAAYFLAKAGIKTAIVEKEKLPRHKTCGGGLVYKVHKILPFSFEKTVHRYFDEVDISFINEGENYSVKRDFPIISMTMRDSFDHLITQQAQSEGAQLLEETTVKSLNWNNNLIELNTNTGVLRSHLVIAADGVLGPTAKMAGWHDGRHLIPAVECEVFVDDKTYENLDRVRFDIDAMESGYGWVFPKADHLSIGVASTKRGKYDLKKITNDYKAKLGIKNSIQEKWFGFQIPLSTRDKVLAKDQVILLGDAAGLADPVTAEGISNALLSGKIAAESIIDANCDPNKSQAAYNINIQKKMVSHLNTASLLAEVLYNKQWFRSHLVKNYGQKMCEGLTDVFTGDRNYPDNIKKKLVEFAGRNLKQKLAL